MKPYLKILLFGVGVLCIAAAGNIYYEVLPGLQIKHPITGATTATINGTNGTVTAGFFVGNGSGLTGLPSGGAIVGTLVTNGASATAGALVKFGTRLTNTVDAASADVQSALGQVYLATNAPVTILQGSGTGLTITNTASQVGLAVNGFSGQTANLATIGAGGTNGLTIDKDGQVLLGQNGDGSSLLGLAFASHPHSGFRNVSGNISLYAGANVPVLSPSATGLTFWGGTLLCSGVNSIIFEASDFQLGSDAASPVSQTLKSCDGSGTDKVGASLTLEGGQSTGNQAAGGVAIATGLTGEASGSTANAYSTRAWYHPKFVALTHATATEIQKFSLAANKILGGEMVVTIYATNSVPHAQVITSRLLFQALAIGTTITGTVDAVNGTQASDTGTLTITGYTLVDNTDNTFSIKAQVSSDLATPTERAKIVVTALNGNAAVTITDP